MIAREDIVESVGGQLFSEGETRVFAILDGASIPDLLERLYELQPEYVCLYSGELEPDMAQVAPYLVSLEQNSEFADWVIQNGWGNHWGIYAIAGDEIRVLRRHLRALLTVYDSNGKPMLFRYYDPRVLRTFLPTCTDGELQTMFGPVEKYVLEGQDPEVGISFRIEIGTLAQRKIMLATGM
jgi:hypothetical protein